MFFTSQDFQFTKQLEAHWRDIREEVERLNSHDFIAWPEKFLYDGQGWDVFRLYANRQRIVKHCGMCPKTSALLENIPGIVMAGFSSIAPNTHIKPHRGSSDAVLRCHVGLIIPSDVGLRVGTETRIWQEGRCLIFDDTYEHETWNRSNRTRIILMIEFQKKVSTARLRNLQPVF
ncbi:MAG: aspartyl/asparaginyl beta-hydroxylase domain-containing protein [Chlamydiales bacterium]|nr:aspartyl/asparaginyl beta-hydroxylase domain-containing protein [Chlamydiales bacterium]